MNRIGTVAACLVLGFLSNAYADETGAKPEWFACEKDHDCGRGENVCGEPQGINLKHYKEYHTYLDNRRAVVECAPPRKVFNLRELHSVCVEHQCSFHPAPDFGGQH